MSQHTPGPWYCDPSDTRRTFPARQEVYGGGSLLAEVAGNGYGSSGANAQLIAAAPDLLAACRQARELLDYMAQNGPRDADAVEARDNILAAIAKAEGRS